MSVLVVFWLLLRPITNVVRYTSLPTCCSLAFCCFAWSFLVAGVPLLGNLFNDDELLKSRLSVVVRASPVGYVHTFVGGIACARIFILTAMHDAETLGPVNAESRRIALDSSRAPWFFRFGCCLGYSIYILLVALAPSEWVVSLSSPVYYFSHNGGLMPVMGLVLLGAAVGIDPLAEWIFKSHPFLMLGRISYIQYLFQRSIWNFVKEHAAGDILMWLYPIVLIAWAYSVQRWLQAPLTDWQISRMESGTKGVAEKTIDWLERIGNPYRTLMLFAAICVLFVPAVWQLVYDPAKFG